MYRVCVRPVPIENGHLSVAVEALKSRNLRDFNIQRSKRLFEYYLEEVYLAPS